MEDIYNILQISHTRRKANPELPPPKAKLMAAYYEKLTTLFWVSENHLFHAFAWYKYYALCKEYNKSMSEELKRRHASAVLLAALCIPSMPKSNALTASAAAAAAAAGGTVGTAATGLDGMGMTADGTTIDAMQQLSSSTTNKFDDTQVQEKMARMATLLGFHTRNPTRDVLLEEIKTRGIFEQVPEYLQQLYYLLEEDSNPLVLVEKAKPLLTQLSQEIGSSTGGTSEEQNDSIQDTTLGRYVQPLTSVLLLKLLLNLSTAYHTVKMDQLKELTDGLGMTFEHVEKAIVLFTQTHKGLVVRMDHRAGCLRFGDAQLESDAMRSQLTVLAHQLEQVCRILDPAKAKLASKISPQERSAMFQSIRDSRNADHVAILERKAFIEKRKEEAERLAQEKIREEEQKR